MKKTMVNTTEKWIAGSMMALMAIDTISHFAWLKTQPLLLDVALWISYITAGFCYWKACTCPETPSSSLVRRRWLTFWLTVLAAMVGVSLGMAHSWFT